MNPIGWVLLIAGLALMGVLAYGVLKKNEGEE